MLLPEVIQDPGDARETQEFVASELQELLFNQLSVIF